MGRQTAVLTCRTVRVPEYLAAARKSMGVQAAAEFEKNGREMDDHMAATHAAAWLR